MTRRIRRPSKVIFALLVLLIIMQMASYNPSYTTEEKNIRPISPFVLSAYDSEWLFVNAFDDSNTAWTESGADPYLGDNTDYIYVSTDDLTEGWFEFPDTSCSGTITANISVYAKNDDGAGNDHFDIVVDYTGGSGSILGSPNLDTSYAWFTYSIGDLTEAQVNNIRVQFVSDMVTQPDDVYIERVKIGLIAEVASGDNYEVTINEVLDIADSANTAVNWSAKLQEIISLDSSVKTAVNWSATLSEVIDFYDSVIAEIVEAGDDYSITINEVIDIVETITTKLDLVLLISELIGVLESVSAVMNPVEIITLIINEVVGVVGSEIIDGGLEGLNVFYDLFLSNNLWGYLGVVGLVLIGYFITKKEKGLGVFMMIVYFLLIGSYLTLIDANPAYWWQVIILLFGVMFCIVEIAGR